MSHHPRPHFIETTESSPHMTITLPYVQGLSEPIRRVLEDLNIKVRFRPNCTLRQMLVKPKDAVPIPCKDCPKTYIGQSKRSLQCRMKEHERAVKNGDFNGSAIAEHCWRSGHRADWSAAAVIDSCPHWYPRCILESWHIHREKDSLNRDRGILPALYDTLLPI